MDRDVFRRCSSVPVPDPASHFAVVAGDDKNAGPAVRNSSRIAERCRWARRRRTWQLWRVADRVSEGVGARDGAALVRTRERVERLQPKAGAVVTPGCEARLVMLPA